MKSKGSLFCIDWAALEFELLGSSEVSRHQSMDIEAQSCSTYVALFGKESEDEADCEDDLDKAISYLANTALVIISN